MGWSAEAAGVYRRTEISLSLLINAEMITETQRRLQMKDITENALICFKMYTKITDLFKYCVPHTPKHF